MPQVEWKFDYYIYSTLADLSLGVEKLLVVVIQGVPEIRKNKLVSYLVYAERDQKDEHDITATANLWIIDGLEDLCRYSRSCCRVIVIPNYQKILY